MDQDATQKLRPQLLPGEKLIWAGRPPRGLMFRGFDLFMIPVTLVWGFATFPTLVGMLRGEALPLMIFGAVFILVGGYLIFGRFIADVLVRRRTYYGLTDRNAAILTEFPKRRFQLINLRTIPNISYNENSSGRGDIVFGSHQSRWFSPKSVNPISFSSDENPVFERVEDVKRVYRKVSEVQKSLSAT